MTKQLNEIEEKLNAMEIKALKIKAMHFYSFQKFTDIHKLYEVGEVYEIDDKAYTIITGKTEDEIKYVVIVKAGTTWKEFWRDADREFYIKKGIYFDLITGKELKGRIFVKAHEKSYFKSIGDDDLVVKGRMYR